jgi:predicted thioredoxin/glutaredoxin
MADVEIFIHATCPSSARLLSELKGAGLAGKVKIIDTSLLGPSGVLRHNVWSVPWMVVDGEPAAADPISLEEVKAALEGRKLVINEDYADLFMNTVLHSSYASVQVVVHGSLEPVLDESLASAAVRSPLSGIDPDIVLSEVKENADKLYREWIDKLARVAGMAVARMLYWAKGSLTKEDLKSIDENIVAALLLSLASLGRAGIPVPVEPKETARVVGFLRRGAAGLAKRIPAMEYKWLRKE